jgi:sulfate adenylyltransferase subunit 2
MTRSKHSLSHLQLREAESIHILREVAAQFERPVILYSVGKDSSVLVHLARKAFYPDKIPFPLLHVDTGYKFKEMYEFRDAFVQEIGAKLIVYRNEAAISSGANPYELGTKRCCDLLKTQGLLQALSAGKFDAAIGGARRDEEKSRAKERVFSFRDKFGQWEPRNQRPELWSLYNGRINPGESIRVFPLSNWTELDIWHYIHVENIPVVPLYFAKEREMVTRGSQLIPGLLPLHRRSAFRRRRRARHCKGDDGSAHLRTGDARDRSRQRGVDGNQKERGVLLDGLSAPRQERIIRGEENPRSRHRRIPGAKRRGDAAALLHRRKRG